MCFSLLAVTASTAEETEDAAPVDEEHISQLLLPVALLCVRWSFKFEAKGAAVKGAAIKGVFVCSRRYMLVEQQCSGRRN